MVGLDRDMVGLDRDKLERVGIDKLVLSGIKIETDKKSLFTEGQGWIEEKFEIKEELYSIQTSTEKIDYNLKQIKYEEGKKAIKEHKGVTFVGEDE